MHSPASLWLIAPFMAFVIGVILLSQGRSAQQSLVKRRELSKATILGVRAVLVSTGLFLAVGGALLAFGLMKR